MQRLRSQAKAADPISFQMLAIQIVADAIHWQFQNEKAAFVMSTRIADQLQRPLARHRLTMNGARPVNPKLSRPNPRNATSGPAVSSLSGCWHAACKPPQGTSLHLLALDSFQYGRSTASGHAMLILGSRTAARKLSPEAHFPSRDAELDGRDCLLIS